MARPEAIVLMGGRATRLGALARSVPKALLPICGVPFLELLVTKLRRDGFGRIVWVADRPRAELERLAARHDAPGRRIAVSFATGGTAPAVLAGLRTARSPKVLCVNGDTILDVDYSWVIGHHERSPAPVTLLTTTRRDAPNPGAIRIAADGGVRAFAEGPRPAPRAAQSGERLESNCGCYGLDAEAVAHDIHEGGDRSFEHETLPRLVARGGVGALSSGERYFADFGTPERLSRVTGQSDILRGIYGL